MIRKFRDPGAAVKTACRYGPTILMAGLDEAGYFWALGRKLVSKRRTIWSALQQKGGFEVVEIFENKGDENV